MRNFILIFLFSFNLLNITVAQVDTAWVKRFNGPLNSADGGLIVKVDEDGYVYVGCSISKTPGLVDAAVIKYTPDGDTLWLRYFNNQYNSGSALHDLQIDKNGNIIITGQCGSVNLSDYFTMKLDSDGSILWYERYDGGDMDIAQAMDIDDGGNIFITGSSWKVYQSNNLLTIKYTPDGDTVWTYQWAGQEDASDLAKVIKLDSYGNIVIGGTFDWHWGTVDYVILKLNPTGNKAWIKIYDSPQNAHDYLKALVIDNQDNIYVTGDIYKPGGNHDIVTIKYNSNGDTIWTRRYNGPSNGDDIVNAMAIDSAGNIYLAGSSFVSGNGIDCLTMKYNSNGVLMWAKTYAEYSFHPDGATAVALDNSGNIYVTGSAGTSSSNIAYLTIKYDNDGNEKWIMKYDGPIYNGYDISSSVTADNSGFVYITGSSAGISSADDIATIKYVQNPNDIDDNTENFPSKFELFQNYPNPFNPNTSIQYAVSRRQFIKLTVYDLLGREVETLLNEEKVAGTYKVTWNAENQPSGIYFYQLKAGEFMETKKMVLLR